MPEQVPETNSILLFLKKHAPFNQMLPAHLEFLSLHLKPVFYSCDDRIIQPEDGTIQACHEVDPEWNWSTDNVRVIGAHGSKLFIGTVGGRLYAFDYAVR